MIKDKRIGRVVLAVLAAVALSTVSLKAQAPASVPEPAEVSALESASRGARAFVEMVAKSSALTEKKVFKGFRVSSCPPPLFAAPTIGVPARSQPALSLCKP